jgi:hypothetical protein
MLKAAPEENPKYIIGETKSKKNSRNETEFYIQKLGKFKARLNTV